MQRQVDEAMDMRSGAAEMCEVRRETALRGRQVVVLQGSCSWVGGWNLPWRFVVT
jgi:hypothetical protein